MEGKESVDEGPFDVVVPADDALWVSERVDEVHEAIGGIEGALKLLSAPGVAAVRDHLGDVLVDRIDDDEVEYMSSNQPDKHEDAKHDVARDLVLKVFKDFCKLQSFGQSAPDENTQGSTHVLQVDRLTERNKSTTSIKHRIRFPTFV